MRIIKSDLDTVGVKPSQYPPDTLPEIAFAGRSNVGKSSLLNLLTGRKKISQSQRKSGQDQDHQFLSDQRFFFRIVDFPDMVMLKFPSR